MMKFQRLLPATALAFICSGACVSAQDVAAAQSLSIELNDLVVSEKGCKFTFVADNGLEQSLSKISFEFVLFDQKGLVERMAVLDFRDLPAGKTKVRQFDLPGTKCEAIKSLLINDTPVCAGEGLAEDACMKALKTGSKSAVELKG